MSDLYKDFAALAKGEKEGTDYRICVTVRDSAVAIVAPHGGRIERGTSEIAATIAENNHSLYCFEGIRKRPHRDLHITSTNFDEPECINLISNCEIVIAVHGLGGQRKAVEVGGRDETLRNEICENLKAAGFETKVVTTGNHAAISPDNICNKGRRGTGVQLEITRGLRDALLNGTEDLSAFAKAVQRAIPSSRSS